MPLCASVSPAGKGLTSWLWFVISNCQIVTLPLLSWVRCGAWLHRFLIFALLFTFILLINQSEQIGEKQLSFYAPEGAKLAP